MFLISDIQIKTDVELNKLSIRTLEQDCVIMFLISDIQIKTDVDLNKLSIKTLGQDYVIMFSITDIQIKTDVDPNKLSIKLFCRCFYCELSIYWPSSAHFISLHPQVLKELGARQLRVQQRRRQLQQPRPQPQQ